MSTAVIVVITVSIFCIIAFVAYMTLKTKEDDYVQVQIQQPIQQQAVQQAVKGKARMKLGEVLKPGIANALYSANNNYLLLIRGNGELQLRRGGITTWRTNIYSSTDIGCKMTVESRGMVIRDQGGRQVWALLNQEYLDALQLKIDSLLISDSGQLLLQDLNGNTVYTLNQSRLPAMAVRSKIDKSTFLGSHNIDTVLALNEKGQLVQASCLPSFKNSCLCYHETDQLARFTTNSAVPLTEQNITSLELNDIGVITYKQGQVTATISIPGLSLVTMDYSGGISLWSSFENYMNGEPLQFYPADEQCKDVVKHRGQDSFDFVICKPGLVLRASKSPIYLTITETGAISHQVQHLDQTVQRVISGFAGIEGFKSKEQAVVLVFGPVYTIQRESLQMPDTLNKVAICVVDSRPFDQVDSRLDYIYVEDPNRKLANTKPIQSDSTYNTYVQQKSMSRLILIKQFYLIRPAWQLQLTADGKCLFTETDDKVVGALQRADQYTTKTNLKFVAGDRLDVLIQPTAGIPRYMQVTTKQPFDEQSLFEAQDATGSVQINIQKEKIIVIDTKRSEYQITSSESFTLQGKNASSSIYIQQASQVLYPQLTGPLQGRFIQQCKTVQTKLESKVICGKWYASGLIDLDPAVITGEVQNGFINGVLYYREVQFEITCVLKGSQLVGSWRGMQLEGVFAIQSASSYSAIDVKVDSSECQFGQNWQGSYTQDGQTVNFTMLSFKIENQQVTAFGQEGIYSFNITGIQCGSRFRLIKEYYGSSERVAMYLQGGQGYMRGFQLSGGQSGTVDIVTL